MDRGPAGGAALCFQMLSNLKVVLVSPLQSGNVGSVCRAMANMGVSDLWVVAPRIADNAWEDGEKMACHAGTILAARHTVDTLAEAVEYARAKGIARVDHIGEEIEIIEL